MFVSRLPQKKLVIGQVYCVFRTFVRSSMVCMDIRDGLEEMNDGSIVLVFSLVPRLMGR
jgi:hypothetical protein